MHSIFILLFYISDAGGDPSVGQAAAEEPQKPQSSQEQKPEQQDGEGNGNHASVQAAATHEPIEALSFLQKLVVPDTPDAETLAGGGNSVTSAPSPEGRSTPAMRNEKAPATAAEPSVQTSPGKRRRGRPRKDEPRPLVQNCIAAHAEPALSVGKRRRGRPEKGKEEITNSPPTTFSTQRGRISGPKAVLGAPRTEQAPLGHEEEAAPSAGPLQAADERRGNPPRSTGDASSGLQPQDSSAAHASLPSIGLNRSERAGSSGITVDIIRRDSAAGGSSSLQGSGQAERGSKVGSADHMHPYILYCQILFTDWPQ